MPILETTRFSIATNASLMWNARDLSTRELKWKDFHTLIS